MDKQQRPPNPSIFPAWLTFHVAHPDVYEIFKKKTFELISAGKTNYSSDGVLTSIRWDYDTSSKATHRAPKLNNNFTPFYARLFMAQFPEYTGFFRLRVSVADDIDFLALATAITPKSKQIPLI